MQGPGARWSAPAQIRGVLFDVHSTLVDQGGAHGWLDLALASLGRTRGSDDHEGLASLLDHIWERARVLDPDSRRDLSAQGHREVFGVLLADAHGVDAALEGALYDCMLDTWRAYDDAVPVLRRLHGAGIRIGYLSNVGVPIDGVLRREGLAPWAHSVTQSWQVGSVKPDEAVFRAALAALGTAAHDTLMVGDSGKDDAGAAHLGIRTLLLPRTDGREHGLGAVTALVLGFNAAIAEPGDDLPSAE